MEYKIVILNPDGSVFDIYAFTEKQAITKTGFAKAFGATLQAAFNQTAQGMTVKLHKGPSGEPFSC
jgi:hypothetical protein